MVPVITELHEPKLSGEAPPQAQIQVLRPTREKPPDKTFVPPVEPKRTPITSPTADQLAEAYRRMVGRDATALDVAAFQKMLVRIPADPRAGVDRMIVTSRDLEMQLRQQGWLDPNDAAVRHLVQARIDARR